MALVKCSECSADVSDSAYKCPRCGKTLRKPRRGFFGQLFKWTFILFNVLMLIWLISGVSAAQDVEAVTEAEKAGRDAGTAIGVGIIVTIWALGSVILGLFVLFTRPKTD